MIAGARGIQVTLYDGTSLAAQLVGSDPLDDLAVLKISTNTRLTAATLGGSAKLQVGQEVLAIGNPLGITQTVTSGIVSALDRAVSSIPDAIQTDVATTKRVRQAGAGSDAPRNAVKIIALFGGSNPDVWGYPHRTTIVGRGRREQRTFSPGFVKELSHPKDEDFFDHIFPHQLTEVITNQMRPHALLAS